MIYFPCPACATSLSADPEQIGQMVKCPHCAKALRVPKPSAVAPMTPPPSPAQQKREAVAKATAGFAQATGKRYGFGCPYCSSRLEATEHMAAQEGQCPTCGNNIIIPILDRYGRLVDPVTRKIIKQDPHPVHAYAAAGVRAPKIHRKGKVLTIECPRCQAISPITSNNCGSCQLPFTMEGTTATISPQTNGMAMASLVLGILSLPAGCTIVIPVLAIVFGGIALARPTGTSRGKNMAITGIACGLLGLAVFFMLNR